MQSTKSFNGKQDSIFSLLCKKKTRCLLNKKSPLTLIALENNTILFFVNNKKAFFNKPIARLAGQIAQLLFVELHGGYVTA